MTSTKLIVAAAVAILLVVAVEAKYQHRHYSRSGSGRRPGLGMCLRKLCFQCHRYWIKKQTRHRRDISDLDEATAPSSTAEAIAAARHNIDAVVDYKHEDYDEEEEVEILPEEEESDLMAEETHEMRQPLYEPHRFLFAQVQKCASWRRSESRSDEDEGARACAWIRHRRRKLARSSLALSKYGELRRRSKLKRSASTHKARCVRVINTPCCQQVIKQRAQIIGLVVRRH